MERNADPPVEKEMIRRPFGDLKRTKAVRKLSLDIHFRRVSLGRGRTHRPPAAMQWKVLGNGPKGFLFSVAVGCFAGHLAHPSLGGCLAFSQGMVDATGTRDSTHFHRKTRLDTSAL
jgi:hypothetical protein